MSTNFYQDLASFQNFPEFTNSDHFSKLPDDWSIFITDVRGSTKAIAEGRYKEVNTMGAATIVSVSKILKEFPFVFGGDGATVLIPNAKVTDVKQRLLALKKLAWDQYQLDLRVGCVPMRELVKLGKEVWVARFGITKGKDIAILKGEGITEAERLIKSPESGFELTGAPEIKPDLSGLSCRWNPIPSRHGIIMTLIVKSRKGDEVYIDIMQELEKILPHGIENANPTNVDLASYKNLRQILQEERKMHSHLFSIGFLARFLEAILSVLIFKLGLKPLVFDPKKYASSMRTHSDFRKFDDTLRMVIDCSTDDASKILAHLDKCFHKQDLFYGFHQTQNSLMTCFVDGLGQGEHIHFIDAENGGYTAAATALKKQMAV